ncbi:hypothetical protein Cni_G19545 [Canna indica]|uniref:Uncharacterized protein n=1 Tax=Canna indica TaxID=4628 RepID=A0AAQ3QIM3_9LILI|nr:hypothetical protein Cni_G19545 [Canna indica]
MNLIFFLPTKLNVLVLKIDLYIKVNSMDFSIFFLLFSYHVLIIVLDLMRVYYCVLLHESFIFIGLADNLLLEFQLYLNSSSFIPCHLTIVPFLSSGCSKKASMKRLLLIGIGVA